MAPTDDLRLDRERGGASAAGIVEFASKPLLAPVAPSVPAHFRRAHPVVPHVLPPPAAEGLFSLWGAKGAALVLPPPLPLTPPGPNPLKIQFPFSRRPKTGF